MTLSSYIRMIGVGPACKLFGVSRSTVNQWRDLASVPRPEKAAVIVRKTGGIVSWEGIYKPFAKRVRK